MGSHSWNTSRMSVCVNPLFWCKVTDISLCLRCYMHLSGFQVSWVDHLWWNFGFITFLGDFLRLKSGLMWFVSQRPQLYISALPGKLCLQIPRLPQCVLLRNNSTSDWFRPWPWNLDIYELSFTHFVAQEILDETSSLSSQISDICLQESFVNVVLLFLYYSSTEHHMKHLWLITSHVTHTALICMLKVFLKKE